jgi:DNA-binding GntR family transcriptional regulator
MPQAGYRSMTEIAYEHVLQKVHTRSLKPGEKVVIEDISKELNMSRIPVREAVKQLGSEGILVLDTYRSPRVRSISREDMRQIYELRQILEPRAAILAMSHFGAEDHAALRELCAQTESAVRERLFEQYIAANRDFHFFIYRRCGNRWLVDYITSLWNFARWINVATLFDQAITRDYVANHGAICRAIADGDARGVESGIVRHLDDALAATLALLARLETHDPIRPNPGEPV